MTYDRLLPYRPKPNEDESFYSWLIRTARGNGLKPGTFCYLLWGNRQIVERDLDNLSDEGVMTVLAARTGTDPILAQQTVLRTLEGRLFERHYPFRSV